MDREIKRKSFFSIAVLFIFIILAIGSADSDSGSSSSKNWWEGGTLHHATIKEWKKASYENKLATCADWLAATSWKDNLNTSDDFNKLKAKAELLVKAVDGSLAEDESLDDMAINEIAAMLITISNDLEPENN